MVHNGIEYGLMAAYAEGFEPPAPRRSAGSASAPRTPRPRRSRTPSTTTTSSTWPRSRSSGGAAASSPRGCSTSRRRRCTSRPSLDGFAGRVSDSGEGRWTSIAAIETGTPTPVLTTALYARFESRGEADFAYRVLSAMRAQFGGHVEKPA